MNAIKTAIDLVGSATNFAAYVGVTPQAVCFWRDGKRQVPADKCPLIERMTDGKVTCESLRADVDWDYIRGTSKATANHAPAAIKTVAAGVTGEHPMNHGPAPAAWLAVCQATVQGG